MAIAFPSKVLSFQLGFNTLNFQFQNLPLKKREKETKNNSLRALETRYFRGTTTPERLAMTTTTIRRIQTPSLSSSSSFFLRRRSRRRKRGGRQQQQQQNNNSLVVTATFVSSRGRFVVARTDECASSSSVGESSIASKRLPSSRRRSVLMSPPAKAASITPSDDYLDGERLNFYATTKTTKNAPDDWLNASEKRKRNILLPSSSLEEEDADDDIYQLTREDESVHEEMWLEIMEIVATFGTIGGGIAAVALGEVYLCSLVIVLPILAFSLKKKRETKVREKTRMRLMQLKEELMVVTRNKTTNATVMNLSSQLQKKNMVALEFAIQRALKEDGAEFSKKIDARLDALERAMQRAAEKQAASQRDSGAVAGMLARDVADARIDQRENFKKMYRELEEATKLSMTENERTRQQVQKELETLWELVENVEREISGVSDGVGERLTMILEARAAEQKRLREEEEEETEKKNPFENKAIAEFAFSEELQNRVDEIAKLADAVQRVKEAIDARNEAELGNELISKMDESQWQALGLRFDALSEMAETTAERVVSEISESIEKKRGVFLSDDDSGDANAAMINAMKMGANKIIAAKEKEESYYSLDLDDDSVDDMNESKTGFERALRRTGSVEMVAETVKASSDEDSRRRQEPSASMQTRMAMQQPTTSTSETNSNSNNNSKESFSSSVTSDAPINAQPGVTKESAFENMQAMLRTEEVEEDIFDPFAGIAASASEESSEVTASAISEIVTDIADAKKQVDQKAQEPIALASSSSSSSFDEKIASGLESLRQGRKLARAAEDESAKPAVSLENLMSAEECFANAANDFVVAVEVEPSAVSAKGNLGNALLARGVALRALRDATAERVFGSSSKKGAFGGLSEEDVRFYGETAEDALVDAGKYFRAVAVEDRTAAAAADENEQQASTSSSSSVAVIVALIAWGRALSQRGALVRDDAEVFNLYDSEEEEDESVITSNLADASKLFLAAAEKHRAAIEKCASAEEEQGDAKKTSAAKTLIQSRRIEAYCRWGEALESAAECEFALGSGKERELWTAASGAYGESERLGEESGAATAGVERCEAKLGEDFE